MATRFRLNFEAILGISITALAGGTLTFCISGGSPSQLQTIYSNDALTTPKTNPVELDSAGEHGDIFLLAVDYRIIVKDALGSVIPRGDIDPYHGGFGVDASDVLVTADGATNSQTMADRFRRNGYNLMDFLSSTEQAQVAAGGNALDLAPKWVTAMQTIHDAGGGTLYLPPGVIAASNAAFEWTLAHSINIIGAGPLASIIKKFGAGTDPILDFSSDAATVLDVRSEWRDFSIDGRTKASDGLKLTNISTSVTSNVYIHDCLNALNTFGALNMEHYNIGLRANVNGYVARKSANNIYCNQVSFYGGQIIGNTGLGADMRQGQGWAFHGVAFESNGTTADLGTGAVLVRDTADDEAGFSRASLYNCHFESNKGGRDILTENCTNLTLSVRDCITYTPEGSVSTNIGIIAEAIFDNFRAPGYNVTIAASAIRLNDFNIGGGTLADGSGAKFYQNVIYNSSGQPNQATLTTFTGVNSAKGVLPTVASATATTIFAIPASTAGRWTVHAYVPGETTANYSAITTVDSSGTTDARATSTTNGAHLILTLSGLNVQVTQDSGLSQVVRFSVTRQSDL